MRKIILVLALLVSAVVVNAQEAIQTSKWYDNISIGITGGVTTPLDFNSVFPLNVAAGLKLQKDFTPVFGLQAEGIAILNDNHFTFSKNTVKATNVGINGVFNVFNALKGYKGSPRVFEICPVAGLGWLYYWNTNDHFISAKTGVDLNFNLGKGHSFVITPAIYWNLNKWNEVKFDKHTSQLSLMASYVYHFKNSNGTHSFRMWDVGAMMDEINRLNEELSRKPTEVEVVRTEVKELPGKVVTVDNSYIVTFAKGSCELSDFAKETLNIIPAGINVRVFATASPEGTPSFNKELSQLRADAVKDYLTDRGIKVLTADGYGVVGETSNRIAVITIQ